MARRRMIDPEFFLDEDMSMISAHARLLYIGSWTIADDRVFTFPFRPNWYKVQIFPYENVNIKELTIELVKKGKWQIFQNGTSFYVFVKNMGKYQTINRPSNQKYPAFDAEKQVKIENLFNDNHDVLNEQSVSTHSEVKLSEVKLSKKDTKDTKSGNEDSAIQPASPSAPVSKLSIQTQFVENFKILYEKMTQQPYRYNGKHFIIAHRLIKEHGYDEVVKKVKLLAVLCRDKAVWFTRGGWADFSIEHISNKWNELIPEVKYDPEAIKQMKVDEMRKEMRERNERINKIIKDYQEGRLKSEQRNNPTD